MSDVAAALLPPEEYADPGGNVFKSLLWPPEPWALAEDARLELWIWVAARLSGADPPTADRTLRMGPALGQTPLPTAAGPYWLPSWTEPVGVLSRMHVHAREDRRAGSAPLCPRYRTPCRSVRAVSPCAPSIIQIYLNDQRVIGFSSRAAYRAHIQQHTIRKRLWMSERTVCDRIVNLQVLFGRLSSR